MRLFVILLVLLASGCSIIMPSTTNWIDDQAGNATAINQKVQADTTMPAYAKEWWAGEALSWQYMSDIAHHRHPTSQPAGVK